MQSEDKKKISVYVYLPYIRLMEDRGLSQTEAVTKGLDILFSEDYEKIEEYKKRIIEDEKKIIVLEARLAESESYRALLLEQNELSRAHISQVQSLLQQMDNERRSREDIIRQKENKILLLEDKKRKWYRFW